MPHVQFLNREHFLKAIEVVLEMGGWVRSKSPRTLVVSRAHYKAFIRAGLVRPYDSEKETRINATVTPDPHS
jgi:hypothetical protein